MNLRDQKHTVPGYRAVSRRQRRKPYGSEHPTTFENTVLTVATLLICGVCLMASFMAFPEFCGQMIEQGREIASAAMGVVK